MVGVAPFTESFSFEDGQPVQLEDGSMAYIHRTPKGGPWSSRLVGKKSQNWQGPGSQHKHCFPRDTALLTREQPYTPSLGQTTQAAASVIRWQQVLNIGIGFGADFGTRPAIKT